MINPIEQHPSATECQPAEETLPIVQYEAEIKNALSSSDRVVIIGETGSGKTTEVPWMIHETLAEKLGRPPKVLVTQPRRLAARSVASYVARKNHLPIGGQVGYRVRFDDQTTEGTELTFLTDGIVLRQIQNDPLLRGIDAVMIDEVHERSVNIDLLLGLLRQVQANRVEAGLDKIEIVVASATITADKFTGYFNDDENEEDAPVVNVPGRLKNIDLHYTSDQREVFRAASDGRVEVDLETIKKRAVETVGQILLNTPGDEDILIFMPGEREIEETIAAIRGAGQSEQCEILPLHGRLEPEEQDKIFQKSSRRRIIVSTNVAETSVTVPGIVHVIDSGVIKQTVFDARSGIDDLRLVQHSQAGASQRAGRAGRVRDGHCWRLYSESEMQAAPKETTPEIQRSSLSQTALLMKSLGVEKLEDFPFIDPPDAKQWHQAISELKMLGALDLETETLTEMGEFMAELPIEPRIARMIVEAREYGCVEDVISIAALINGKSIFFNPKKDAPLESREQAKAAHARFRDPSSDFITMLNVVRQINIDQPHNTFQWAKRNWLNGAALEEARQVKNDLLRIVRRNGYEIESSKSDSDIKKAVAAGLLGNLLVKSGIRPQGMTWVPTYTRLEDGLSDIAAGRDSQLRPTDDSDDLAQVVVTSDISGIQINGRRGSFIGYFTGPMQTVSADDLRAVAPHLLHDVPGYTDLTPEGQVVERYSVELRRMNESSSGFFIERDRRRPADPEKTRQKLASCLASLHTYLNEIVPGWEDIGLANRDEFDRYNGYAQRSQGTIDKLEPAQWYEQKLQRLQIANINEIADHLPDFKFTVESAITADQREAIDRAFPTSIDYQGLSIPIIYEKDGLFPEGIIARVVISDEMLDSDLSEKDFPLQIRKMLRFEHGRCFYPSSFSLIADLRRHFDGERRSAAFREVQNRESRIVARGVVEALTFLPNLEQTETINFGHGRDGTPWVAYVCYRFDAYQTALSKTISDNFEEAQKINLNTKDKLLNLRVDRHEPDEPQREAPLPPQEPEPATPPPITDTYTYRPVDRGQRPRPGQIHYPAGYVPAEVPREIPTPELLTEIKTGGLSEIELYCQILDPIIKDVDNFHGRNVVPKKWISELAEIKEHCQQIGDQLRVWREGVTPLGALYRQTLADARSLGKKINDEMRTGNWDYKPDELAALVEPSLNGPAWAGICGLMLSPAANDEPSPLDTMLTEYGFSLNDAQLRQTHRRLIEMTKAGQISSPEDIDQLIDWAMDSFLR